MFTWVCVSGARVDLSVSMLQFSQKGKPGHFLRLSQSTYEQISHGKSVEFFNNYSIRHMVIRLRQSALPTQEAA